MKKLVDGVEITMTSEEVKERQAEEKANLEGTLVTRMALLRNKRNILLAETDWMANSDVSMSSSWKTYRQELRDLTNGLDTEDKVNKVTWPKEPS